MQALLVLKLPKAQGLLPRTAEFCPTKADVLYASPPSEAKDASFWLRDAFFIATAPSNISTLFIPFVISFLVTFPIDNSDVF